MRKNVFGIVVLLIPTFLFSQSLTKERIAILKKAVVKIAISGSTSTGTGFFITSDGCILTCWHVIEPALVKDTSGNLVAIKDIFAETSEGKSKQFFIPQIFFQDINTNAVSNDFCMLVPKPGDTANYTYLKLGKFEDIEEGDEVYTAGYPLGIQYQFISKGTLSTKFVDSSMIYQRKGLPDIKIKKSVALLDLTINKGNSGGPIIKIGATPKDDIVVGIVNFLINPFGKNAEQLNAKLVSDNYNLQLPTGVSITESMKLFSNAIIYSTNGISGCVSINHFLQVLK
jgi:hypothetical protein